MAVYVTRAGFKRNQFYSVFFEREKCWLDRFICSYNLDSTVFYCAFNSVFIEYLYETPKCTVVRSVGPLDCAEYCIIQHAIVTSIWCLVVVYLCYLKKTDMVEH